MAESLRGPAIRTSRLCTRLLIRTGTGRMHVISSANWCTDEDLLSKKIGNTNERDTEGLWQDKRMHDPKHARLLKTSPNRATVFLLPFSFHDQKPNQLYGTRWADKIQRAYPAQEWSLWWTSEIMVRAQIVSVGRLTFFDLISSSFQTHQDSVGTDFHHNMKFP